jgi:hypothetical protein
VIVLEHNVERDVLRFSRERFGRGQGNGKMCTWLHLC